MKTKVGIPRSLLYYKYGVLWSSFFSSLGCEIVTSPKTNKAILNDGVLLSVDENCLPLKIFLGHVKYLKDKVDYVLIPRIVSLKKEESACVKFMAAYDIVQNSFEDINLMEYTVDMKTGKHESWGFFKMGLKFTRNPVKIIKAYKKAKFELQKHDEDRTKEQEKLGKRSKNLKILIVSHPYNIYDELIGKPIVSFLQSQDIDIVFSDLFDHDRAKKLSKKLSRDLYWTYNKELLGAVEYYRNKVDGIIFIVTFPCGPDSLVTELCQRKIKDIPIMTLVLDELQGEAGMKTRLESFVDIIKMKKGEA